MICVDGFLVNEETGEVEDVCYENDEVVQDKELEHYSITPPVPYVPRKYVERMKETGNWIRGKEGFLELQKKMVKKVEFIKFICRNEKEKTYTKTN